MDSPTDTGSHNSLRCVGSLCKVQHDMKTVGLMHPNNFNFL